jgi:hypothetical protein
MKTQKLISFLVLFAISLMFISCETEPIPGPPGADGTNGTDGTDGVDGTTACIECHNIANKEEVEATFALSVHYASPTAPRGTSKDCAQCHNSLGYIEYLTTGEVNQAGYTVSEPIRCITCHKDHTTFDFEEDGYDYALRNFDPVKLVIDNTTIINFEGSSNNCITCHQPRNSYPVPGGTGTVTITSSRYGPHHGPQSTMLEGIMGGNVPGTVAYPAAGSAAHRKNSSCTQCHMAEKNADGTEGLHTYVVNMESCKLCHTSGAPTEASGFTTNFTILEDKLIAKKYVAADRSGAVLGANGNNASASNPLVVPGDDAQAIWNYKTLIEDQSKGVHNPGYTKALLQNSIEALN